MSETLNFYCDESCHLPNDHQKVMTLGTVWCPMERRREISERLREIKARHGLRPAFEVKWSKVSPAKALFYQDWLDFYLPALPPVRGEGRAFIPWQTGELPVPP
jgi:hypothetical protein